MADPQADVDKKRKRLKTGKSEMATLDVEIRKQFAETEQKLKAAKLPPESLPHRQPKAQKREPRMKKENFVRDI